MVCTEFNLRTKTLEYGIEISAHGVIRGVINATK